MSLCIDCKHYRQEASTTPTAGHGCLAMPDYVRGGVMAMDAYTMRSKDGECGPNGKLWETKEPAAPTPMAEKEVKVEAATRAEPPAQAKAQEKRATQTRHTYTPPRRKR